jgi:hypothetical protein
MRRDGERGRSGGGGLASREGMYVLVCMAGMQGVRLAGLEMAGEKAGRQAGGRAGARAGGQEGSKTGRQQDRKAGREAGLLSGRTGEKEKAGLFPSEWRIPSARRPSASLPRVSHSVSLFVRKRGRGKRQSEQRRRVTAQLFRPCSFSFSAFLALSLSVDLFISLSLSLSLALSFCRRGDRASQVSAPGDGPLQNRLL